MSINKTVGVIGLGYVGLPLSIQFANSGFNVLGFEIDAAKVDKLRQGIPYIRHIDTERQNQLIEEGKLEATTDFELLAGVDVVIICVPTPLTQHREPDISYIQKTAESIAPRLAGRFQDITESTDARAWEWLKRVNAQKTETNPPKLIVLESTTYPGTTEEELKPILEKGSGLIAGKDFHLAFSPEREDPGRKNFTVKSIPKVVGGYTQSCLDAAVAVYEQVIDKVHPVSSCSVAEATKLTENIFRSVNIALVNELKMVFDAMGIDVWEVIAAASTKPFGYMPFYPGPGLGGHCIPIDPFYLTWKAREYEKHTRFIELAGEVNTSMPDYVISKIMEALNTVKKSLSGSRILLLGIAYKANVDDDRESVSYLLMDKLEKLGATVEYNDPHIPEIEPTRKYPQFTGRKSQALEDNYDMILVATAHKEYADYDFSQYESVMVDTRNHIQHKPANYFRA